MSGSAKRNPVLFHSTKKGFFYRIYKCRELYLLLLLPVVYLLVFSYYPMYGAQIAFRHYRLSGGIWGSEWVGLDNFYRFFNSYIFLKLIRNTVVLSVYGIAAGFPFPIILALSLNYVKNKFYKKTVQLTTYAPNFISTVVMVGMILQFLSPRSGIVNNLIQTLGGQPVDFMAKSELFPSIYVWSGIWQSMGFSSIIFLAVLSGINPELHESAVIDGASKFKRILYIDIPGLMPTAVILLIMSMGSILNVGFEKVLLMQNYLNLETSQVIATYVYKIGISVRIPDYSYATAIGLFQSVIGIILLVLVNQIARKLGETSLW